MTSWVWFIFSLWTKKVDNLPLQIFSAPSFFGPTRENFPAHCFWGFFRGGGEKESGKENNSGGKSRGREKNVSIKSNAFSAAFPPLHVEVKTATSRYVRIGNQPNRHTVPVVLRVYKSPTGIIFYLKERRNSKKKKIVSNFPH